NCSSYGGSFSDEIFPALPSGLSWQDDLATSGSITVTGTAVPAPVITSARYNPATRQFTLVWSSAASETYSVLLSTNFLTGTFNTTLASGIPSGGDFTTNTVTLPAGNAGFIRISDP